jgi:hypothetical protein
MLSAVKRNIKRRQEQHNFPTSWQLILGYSVGSLELDSAPWDEHQTETENDM